MSVAVRRTPTALFNVESSVTKITNNHEEHADQSAMCTMIQSQKSATPDVTAPYVHPLVRRSSSLMSKSSLEMCTESLGSETGSGDFSDDNRHWLSSSSDDKQQQQLGNGEDGNKLMSANYHCLVSRPSSVPRSFPPPLPSISSSDGTCIQMRTRRLDGRLVVDAVPVASQNYLNAYRQNGRLLLCFIKSTTTNNKNQTTEKTTQEPELPMEEQPMVEQVIPPVKEINQSKEESEGEEEDEEEVEVLNRGTIVEVKVSTQPQLPGGAKKVLRSSLVINKFVRGTPLTNQNRWTEPPEENHRSNPLAASHPPLSTRRRLTATTNTTTAAAAAVAASSASAPSEMVGQQLPLADNKLLFTSKRRNREEMLHHIRRCSELRRPLFFWEAGCIATSS